MGEKPMPNPTEEQQDDPMFEMIWQTIKSWDVNVPEYYQGYCRANGSHVVLILNALKASQVALAPSPGMTSTKFARAWLEREGLFDKNSDYDGWLGKCVLEVWEHIASQGHSGGSASRLFAILSQIHNDYANNDDHPLWKSYWASDEGKKLKESFGS